LHPLNVLLLYIRIVFVIPAGKSFSSEDDQVEKIANHSENTDGRYDVSVDNVTYDMIVSLCVTDAAVSVTV